MPKKKSPPRLATNLVRAGLTRSQHKETAEGLFLTSGFVYDSAEEADARFAGDPRPHEFLRNHAAAVA